MRRSGEDRGRDAARLTNAVAPATDPTAPSAPVPRRNFIDEHIFGRLATAGVPHAGLSSDDEFVRRVYLDATGLPPSTADVRAFVADRSPGKRDRLIDDLLARDEFAEQWAWHWGDLLRMSNEAGPGANAFHYWFKEQLKVDRPYDRFVHDVLTPSAKVHATIPSLAMIGRSNQLKSRFVESVDDYRISNRLDHVDALAIDVSRVFLGLNTSCVSCHDGALHLEDINSYLTDRTRDEFFAMAAFFGKTRLIGNWNDKSRNVDRDLHVDDLAKGYDGGDDAPFLTLAESQFPRPKGSHEPAFILTGEKPRPGAEPRAELARMITAHPQFARATVNLIWGRLMTVGFVEPYDAFDLNKLTGKNAQPSNPELLEALAQDFASQRLPAEADHPHHPAVERLPAVVTLPRRVEGRLHPALPSPLRAGADRPRGDRRGVGGDRGADAVQPRRREDGSRQAAGHAAGHRPRRRGDGHRRADAELLPEQPPHPAAGRQPAVDAAGAADDEVHGGQRPRRRRRRRAASPS